MPNVHITPPPLAIVAKPPPLKKPRNSQLRVSAPRRASTVGSVKEMTQTTFKVSSPGRLTLDLPMSVKNKAVVKQEFFVDPVPLSHLDQEEEQQQQQQERGRECQKNEVNLDENPFSPDDDPSDKCEAELDFLNAHLEDDSNGGPLPMDDASQDFILSLDSSSASHAMPSSLHDVSGDDKTTHFQLPQTPPPFSSGRAGGVSGSGGETKRRHRSMGVGGAVKVKDESKGRSGGVKSVKSRQKKHSIKVKCKSFLTASLQSRLAKMKTNPISAISNSTCTLPLVDAAVQAVARAAREYTDKLSRSFPLSTSSMTAAAAASSIVLGSAPQDATFSKKQRKNSASSFSSSSMNISRRRRVLLSFDDRDVAPLVEDSGSSESVLTSFLNCPSPCSKKMAAALDYCRSNLVRH